MEYKIIIVGDTGTGKSSLIRKFTDGEYIDLYNTTVGVDFRTKNCKVNGENIQIHIWDTAGQERFRTITNSYYRTAEGIILVFDLSNRDTFAGLVSWFDDIRRFEKTLTPIILVGTKSDINKKEIKTKDVEEFITSNAADLKIKYIETSSKCGINVDKVFECLIEEMVKQTNISRALAKTNEVIVIKRVDSCQYCENKNKCCIIL